MVSEQIPARAPKGSRRGFGMGLCRPLPVAAVALLVLNDHVGKYCDALPDLLRGKLSDVAGLFFFPILLFSLVELVAPGRIGRWRGRLAWICAGATSVGFAAVKLWPAANALACRCWGPLVLDPSDCFALPAAALAAIWLRRTLSKPVPPSPAWARTLVLSVAAVASMATPAPMLGRNYPEWRAPEGAADRSLGCARASVWASKTGKAGAGITVRLSADRACQVAVREARFVVEGQDHRPMAMPDAAALEAGGVAHRYVAFAFDGNKAWNEGSRKAQLHLVFHVGDGQTSADVPWSVPLDYRLDGFHQNYRRRRPCE